MPLQKKARKATREKVSPSHDLAHSRHHSQDTCQQHDCALNFRTRHRQRERSNCEMNADWDTVVQTELQRIDFFPNFFFNIQQNI